MKYLTTILLAVLSLSLTAQTTSTTIDQTVSNLKNASSMQNKIIAELQSTIEALNWKIDTALNIADVNTANIELISDTLHLKVLNVHASAHEKIDAIDEIVNQNKTFWMVGSIIFLLFLVLLYVLLHSQIKAASKESQYQLLTAENLLKQTVSNLDEKLNATNLALNANSLKLEANSKELAGTHKELLEVHKALDHSHKELEGIHQEIKTMKENLNLIQQEIDKLKPSK